MTQQRWSRIEKLKVKECERCKEEHVFSLKVIYDEEVDVIGLMGIKTEVQDVILICPKTGKNIVVSVPISLTTLEDLVRVSQSD